MARHVIYETRAIEVSRFVRAKDDQPERRWTERYEVTAELDVDRLFSQHADRACRSSRHRSTVSGGAVVFKARQVAS